MGISQSVVVEGDERQEFTFPLIERNPLDSKYIGLEFCLPVCMSVYMNVGLYACVCMCVCVYVCMYV